MPITVRLDPKTEGLLRRLIRKTGRTKSQIIRDAIERFAKEEDAGGGGEGPFAAFAPYIGIAKGGPPDLSERTGEKVAKMLRERHGR